MEGTIGYRALLSSNQWRSLDLAEWETSHDVAITHDESATTAAYELRCALCGSVGSADDEELASLLARLHETFFTTIVGGSARWERSTLSP